MSNVAALLTAIENGQTVNQAFFTYTAKGTGEKATITVMLGGSVEALYKQDIAILSAMLPNLSGIDLDAANAIIASRQESLEKGIGNNSAYTCKDAYTPIDGVSGVKIHDNTGTVHVTGLVAHKTVLVAGTYKTVNSKPLTIAKNKLSKNLPSSKFRQYILENVTGATVNGQTVEFTME